MLNQGLFHDRGEVTLQPEEGAKRRDGNIREFSFKHLHELSDGCFSEFFPSMAMPKRWHNTFSARRAIGMVPFLALIRGLERYMGKPAKLETPAKVFLLVAGLLGGVEARASTSGACTGTKRGVVVGIS